MDDNFSVQTKGCSTTSRTPAQRPQSQSGPEDPWRVYKDNFLVDAFISGPLSAQAFGRWKAFRHGQTVPCNQCNLKLDPETVSLQPLRRFQLFFAGNFQVRFLSRFFRLSAASFPRANSAKKIIVAKKNSPCL